MPTNARYLRGLGRLNRKIWKGAPKRGGGGQGGQSAPLAAKNLPIKREEIGKNGKQENLERQKLGRFFHFAPPDTERAGYITGLELEKKIKPMSKKLQKRHIYIPVFPIVSSLLWPKSSLLRGLSFSLEEGGSQIYWGVINFFRVINFLVRWKEKIGGHKISDDQSVGDGTSPMSHRWWKGS